MTATAPMLLAATLVVVWAAAVETDWSRLLFDCVLGWMLLALGWIDWHSMRLPDVLTLPLLFIGFGATWFDARDALMTSVIGALAGYAALRLVGICYRLARGHDGIGQGDAKLLAAGGAWLGWPALPSVVLLAAMLGLALALLQHVRGIGLTRDTALPFGPPLALAIWLARMHGLPG